MAANSPMLECVYTATGELTKIMADLHLDIDNVNNLPGVLANCPKAKKHEKMMTCTKLQPKVVE